LLEFIIQLMDRYISHVVPGIVGDHLWLNFVEVGADFAIITSWELLSNLLLHKLTVWSVLADGCKSVFTILEYIWNDHWLSDSATTKKT